MKYSFYFDESFHDRKIKNNNGKVNIHVENSSDSYVAVFVGGSNEKVHNLKIHFAEFEKRANKIFQIEEEIKATTIAKKNFKYGIKSFNKNTLSIYKDFFDIFDNDTYIYVNICSKTAQVIEIVFQQVDFEEIGLIKEAFLYSITKSLNNYRFSNVFEELFNSESLNDKKIIQELIESYLKVINSSNDSRKKRLERNALIQLVSVLNLIDSKLCIATEYAFNYNIVFDSFNEYIKTKSFFSKDIDLYIDNETNTLKAAYENDYFNSIISVDSKESQGVRISDWLSNFIGRMIKALYDDLKEPTINELTEIESYNFAEKKLLSQEWFELSEKHFNLYKLIALFLESSRNQFFWSFYFDYCLIFRALLNYFSNFSSFAEYKQQKSNMHPEYFNTHLCNLINEAYDDFE